MKGLLTVKWKKHALCGLYNVTWYIIIIFQVSGKLEYVFLSGISFARLQSSRSEGVLRITEI